MKVGAQASSSGVLVSAGSHPARFMFSSVRAALTTHPTTDLDATAVLSLPVGTSFGVLINRTSDNPNESGSATPELDFIGANNTTTNLTAANAKALGLSPGSGTVGQCVSTCDASIGFNSTIPFDFDPSGAIQPGTYAFVGFATHEIGHALGFLSGVDIQDLNSPLVGGPVAANQVTCVSALDLFRFSSPSVASDVIDFTVDSRAESFSLDCGATFLGDFSNGRYSGDSQQAGQWKDGLGIGIMDPTRAPGEMLATSATDVEDLDMIGWNAVPEPSGSGRLDGGAGGVRVSETDPQRRVTRAGFERASPPLHAGRRRPS